MTPAHNPWQLFGIDLRQLGALWRSGWEEALKWPVLRQIKPALPVEVILADGRRASWSGTGFRERAAGADGANSGGHAAVVLADDHVLVRELRLPRLSQTDLLHAVTLEVAASSPFDEADQAWGWRNHPVADGTIVFIAMTSRRFVDAALVRHERPAGSLPLEVWAIVGDLPITIGGYGEGPRLRAERTAFRANVLLCSLLGVLLLALLAQPVWQARQEVFDAQRQHAELTAQSGHILTARERLVRNAQREAELVEWLSRARSPGLLLGRLTEMLPDDSHLTAFELRDDHVLISGLSSNAAALMGRFGNEPSFRDVVPSGISRDRTTGLETFRLEFLWVPVEPAPEESQ